MAGEPANLALYRRYRPATFAEVKGQDHVTVPLRQALLAGRVHHAYLFSGPRGCGKTSSARILARSLNCEQGPTPDPCGKCDSCIALAPGGPGSIDVIEIDAASHGGVDDARDLRERAFYAPVSGRYKVYIIDEAHMVTREGFNALLKLVEEPPPHLKFVFATTEPEKVIGTIRSRTHHYPFRLIPPQTVRELLEQVLSTEGVAYDPAVLPLVVRAGAGSARDALSVLDQLLAGSGESGISYSATVALLGYTDASLLDETVDAFAARDGAAVFRVVDKVINAGHDPRRFAADLLDRLRDLIVLGAVADADRSGLLDAPADQLERMRDQAAKFGTAGLTRAAEVLNAGLTEMRGAASPRLQLELTCARVLLPAAETDEAALLTRLEQIERRLALADTGRAPGGQSRAAPQPPAPVAGSHAGEEPRRAASPAPASRGRAAAPAPRGKAAAASDAAARDTSGPAQAGTQSPAEADQPAPAATASGPAASAPAAPGRPAAPGPSAAPGSSAGPGGAAVLDADALRRDWDAILDVVRQIRKVSWIQLSAATVASLEGNVLTLEFARDGDLKGFTASRSDAILAKVLRDRFGVEWRIQGTAMRGGRSGSPGFVPGGSDQVTARAGTSQRPPGPARARGAGPSRTAREAEPSRTAGDAGRSRTAGDASLPREGSGRAGSARGSAPQGAPDQAPSSAPPPSPASRAPAIPRAPAPATSGQAVPAMPGPQEVRAPRPAMPAAVPEPDAYGDADDEDLDGDLEDDLDGGVGADPGLTGMELIRRELGGQIIGEIDATGRSIGPPPV